MVPSSKAHLVSANRALTNTHPRISPPPSPPHSPNGLKDDFPWYISPSDKSKYEAIYNANASPHGTINFSSLNPLYASLDVPDTDINSAWQLVNPSSADAIGKDAALTFLHILNNRHEGYRIPRSVPPSLRASFESKQIDYKVDRVADPAQKWGRNGETETATGRKAKFGDTYLSRLGLGGGSSYRPSGTDFSSATTPDWEEVRLKRQLVELEAKIERVEKQQAEKRGKPRNSSAALVRRELEQLLDYKRRGLRELENGEGRVVQGEKLKRLAEDVKSVREQVEGLEKHLKTREEVLEGLKREVDEEKRK